MVGLPVRFHLQLTASTVVIGLALLLFSACQVSPPGEFETKLMQGAKRRITVGGKGDVNPLAESEENVHPGQRNFTSYCMVCHGLDGQNTGVPFADKMSPPVPMLSAKSVQEYTDGQLHRTFRMGLRHRECQRRKRCFAMKRSGRWCFTSAICQRKAVLESRRCMGARVLRTRIQKDRRRASCRVAGRYRRTRRAPCSE